MTVCVVGLGYVGLPLAEAFARQLKVIGYRRNQEVWMNSIGRWRGISEPPPSRASRDADDIFHQAAIPSVPRSIKDLVATNDVESGMGWFRCLWRFGTFS